MDDVVVQNVNIPEATYRIIKTKNIRKKYTHKKQNCYICGEHRQISELHHLIPLYDAAKYLNVGIKNNTELRFNLPQIWLCPNHHAYFHNFFKEQNVYMLEELLLYDSTISELLAYDSIFQEAIYWFESATNELIEFWNKGEIKEKAFRVIYKTICEDLRDWQFRHKYLKRIMSIRTESNH